jgi:GntR family transcriptional regulator
VDVSVGLESVQPRLQDAPTETGHAAPAGIVPEGHDPLARAQALVAELSAELARLRGKS